jgi:hypothetical protein
MLIQNLHCGLINHGATLFVLSVFVLILSRLGWPLAASLEQLQLHVINKNILFQP